ncbi:hypothetical protein EYR36_000537 [Pleurotus pulmonarius]|nr:hypothetical protein EYR36_004845 [Pleurotus pulmonarius]KAF4578730.1 hypothetical protein EYR36_000537 [Pleurotus pulmonarius]
MFAKFPQKFAAPFGLLGDEPKLAFRSQPGGISKLATARNIPETDSYWDQYTVLFDSASDVFSLITPNDIRRALAEAPENVATLIRVISSRLFNLVSDHTFPSASTASVTAYATSLIKSGTGSAERNTTKEVLNCLRVLQRVLPVVFEVEGEASVFELEVLWKKHEAEQVHEEIESQTPQFVIDDDDDSEDGDARSLTFPKEQAGTKPKTLLPSLGERLFSCLIDLLFCCGFTLPPKLQVDHYKINYIIWEKGVGSTSDPGPSFPYDGNKTEVLRLILVLLSRQIYVPPSSLFTKPSLYTLHLVQQTPRRDVLTILCSLLNTTMSASSYGSSTISSVAGKLPYNHLMFKGEDPRTSLISMCFQVLCVLLDFQSDSARDKPSKTDESHPPTPTPRTNAFRYFLMKLHRVQDFAFIFNGIFAILEQQVANMSNLLPGARKSVPYMFETIVFLWKMIELNEKFRIYLLESERGMDLMAYILCYNLEIKDKTEQHGLCRALSYIIQTLSAEPAFGRVLSNPIKSQIPAKWHTGGTAGDFIVNSIYAIIATTSGTLNSIYPALIIALTNCAPHFKNLTVTSSARLLQLFTSFSNPLFLLADEGHPRLLFFMLEVFNSVILYHLTENPHLIYNILNSHKVFEDLGTFTLARGLREIKRARIAKEEATRKDGNQKSKMRASDIEEGDPHSEKVRLMELEERRTNSTEQLPEAQRTDSTDALPLNGTPASSISEKARGKMKERRSVSLDNIDPAAAAAVGRNGFVPTQEWVTSWQQGLPMDCIMLLITELLPKVQDIQAARNNPTSVTAIIDFLGSVSLQGVLPPKPPLAPRKFVWSDSSIVWLTSMIWGEIYVRGMTPLGIWNATHVRLFYVKHTQAQQRQITEAVSNVVGGIWGRNSDATIGRQRSGGS